MQTVEKQVLLNSLSAAIETESENIAKKIMAFIESANRESAVYSKSFVEFSINDFFEENGDDVTKLLLPYFFDGVEPQEDEDD